MPSEQALNTALNCLNRIQNLTEGIAEWLVENEENIYSSCTLKRV